MEKEMVLLELASNVAKDILFLSTITSIEMPMLVKMKKENFYKLTEIRYKGITKSTEKTNIDLNKDNLNELVTKLEKYTSKKNLNNVYRNIRNLELNKTAILYLIGWNGAYNAKDNVIRYSANKSLPHEFMHMSSAFYDSKEDTIYDGFLVSNKSLGKVGVGLNEGYTELLASRIYRNGKVKAYTKEVKLASIIEQFFYNNKDMEDYYFNHDLPGFIFYMSQYGDKEEIKALINDIDSTTKTNQFLSQSPNYYYVKSLNRLNKLSDSYNLSPKQREKIKRMINTNLIIKTINKANQLVYDKILIKK